MQSPKELQCEVCGEAALVAQNSHVDPQGQRIEWPKVIMKPDGIYLTINCPNCGEQQQQVAERPG